MPTNDSSIAVKCYTDLVTAVNGAMEYTNRVIAVNGAKEIDNPPGGVSFWVDDPSNVARVLLDYDEDVWNAAVACGDGLGWGQDEVLVYLTGVVAAFQSKMTGKQ